ncbi:MAG: ABC transporter ATP-binding protein [Defluviitaleaceae bacterium]|nr:ABC transporter ATP-binding protein [Defluviitaleaceae bacterium]
MILRAENLSKAYKESDFALCGVSLELKEGAIMGIVGENGSGKTTTLDIILGLCSADGGKVFMFGKEYDTDDVETKSKLGVVFDGNYLPEGFTSKDISAVFRRIYKNWDEEYFGKSLAAFEIEPGQNVGNMSKGTKASLSIIVALSQRPQLLIMDEPTAGIDPIRREEMLDIFLEFISDGKKSILFSSHITSDLEKIADYITFIHKGKILDSADKNTFLYKYGIVRCGEDDFTALRANHRENILRYTKRDYLYRVLVNDQPQILGGRQNLSLQNTPLVMENPTLDEVLYLMAKGETP